jgi:DNA-binding response OmpR family regulator
MDTLRLVGLMLQRQGYEVRAANNGLQALSMAQAEKPDLILLDIMMPDMDGYEVARRLRADPATAEVPIIMFTAKTQVDDKVAGFEAGADDYLTKPTQPRELFAHMRAVLTRSTKKGVTSAPSGEKGYMVGVMAARGGLGVTTLTLNLGISLRETFNKEVIVAEFRPGQGSISLELGYLKPEGLNHLLQKKPTEIGTNEIENELTTHASGLRLLLASHQPHDSQYISAIATFEALARQLAYMARYVIVDLGPSLTPVNDKVIKLCDEVIVVIEPVPQSITHTKALIQDLVSSGIGEGRITLVLVNRIRSGVQLSWSQVQEQLGHTISVIFTPAPELAYQASAHNLPIVLQQPDSLTSQQFSKLAERITQRSRQ